MCRTVHSVLQTAICGVQMLVRVIMTTILMIENVIRMLLQTTYNFISFVLQMFSLIPICVVFLLTARLKCFMCGGGGPCPVNRGGTCDCVMSAVAFIILILIFRATGVLDKIFYKMGYAKAYPSDEFSPTPGEITECSRNDTTDFIEYTTIYHGRKVPRKRNKTEHERFVGREQHRIKMQNQGIMVNKAYKNQSLWMLRTGQDTTNTDTEESSTNLDNLTTIIYYLV